MSRCAVMRPAMRKLAPSANFSRASAISPKVLNAAQKGATPSFSKAANFSRRNASNSLSVCSMPASDSKQNQPDEQIEWVARAFYRRAWLSARQTFAGPNSVGKGRRTVRYSGPSEFFPLNSKNMQVELPETTSKIGGPLVRQFSVFLPNKVGAMLEVVKLLNAHATHVVALSVSESTDAAIARIIVSYPERVEELFRENNVA